MAALFRCASSQARSLAGSLTAPLTLLPTWRSLGLPVLASRGATDCLLADVRLAGYLAWHKAPVSPRLVPLVNRWYYTGTEDHTLTT